MLKFNKTHRFFDGDDGAGSGGGGVHGDPSGDVGNPPALHIPDNVINGIAKSVENAIAKRLGLDDEEDPYAGLFPQDEAGGGQNPPPQNQHTQGDGGGEERPADMRDDETIAQYIARTSREAAEETLRKERETARENEKKGAQTKAALEKIMAQKHGGQIPDDYREVWERIWAGVLPDRKGDLSREECKGLLDFVETQAKAQRYDKSQAAAIHTEDSDAGGKTATKAKGVPDHLRGAYELAQQTAGVTMTEQEYMELLNNGIVV